MSRDLSRRLDRLEARQEPRERPFQLFGLTWTTVALAAALAAVDGRTRGIPSSPGWRCEGDA